MEELKIQRDKLKEEIDNLLLNTLSTPEKIKSFNEKMNELKAINEELWNSHCDQINELNTSVANLTEMNNILKAAANSTAIEDLPTGINENLIGGNLQNTSESQAPEPYNMPSPLALPVTANTTAANNSDDRSLLVASDTISSIMNHSAHVFARALLKIEPCLPASGSDTISSTIYNRWKNTLLATMESASMDNQEKINFFRKSAGNLLLDILDVQPAITNRNTEPTFEETIACLDSYFNSCSHKTLARLKFKTMTQEKDEDVTKFVDRMARAACDCGYPTESYNENLMDAIANGTNNDKLREKALQLDSGTDERLTHKQIRSYAESLKMSMALQSKKKGQSEILQVGSSFIPKTQRTFGGNWANRSSNTTDRVFSGQRRPRSDFSNNKACHYCASSSNHNGKSCFARDKECYHCGKKGHIAKACNSRKRQMETNESKKDEFKPKRIKTNEINELICQVSKTDDSESLDST